MISVDNCTVLSSGTVVVEGDESISILLRDPPDGAIALNLLMVKVVFEDVEGAPQGTVKFRAETAQIPTVVLTLTNWKAELTALPSAKIGDHDGRLVYIGLFVHTLTMSSGPPTRAVSYTISVEK